MPIAVECPGCSTALTVSDELAGRKIRCLGCRTVLVVPARAQGPGAFATTSLRADVPTGVSTARWINFPCPACAAGVRVPAAHAGKRGACPYCQALIEIPADAPAETFYDPAAGGPPVRRSARAAPSEAVPQHDLGWYNAERSEPDEFEPVPRRPRRRRRRYRESAPVLERGWFGNTNAGVLGGLVMIIIAVTWLTVGLAAGWLFYYPVLLLIIGVVAVIKGLAG